MIEVSKAEFDVIIVGAGPAGLSAALILGRCRRRTLICDNGHYRNSASHALHGFLSRDGIEPAEFLRIGRQQLGNYDTLSLLDDEVTDARFIAGKFEIKLSNGHRFTSRKLLLTSGVVDEIPQIEGFAALYGRSVFHCPYCDGWEVRDQPLAIYGRGKAGRGLALELTVWSRDLILCTDGPAGLATEELEHLYRNGIMVREERIAYLKGTGGVLESIVFSDGEDISRRALFFTTREKQGSVLPARLGCEFTPEGVVKTDEHAQTSLPGLYVAGDASRSAQTVIVAAAEGAEAAFAINTALLKEDLSN